MKYTVWDTETSTKTSYKRKGNPFDPDNYVVANGWQRGDLTKPVKGGVTVGEYFPALGPGEGTNDYESKAVQRDTDWFTKLLKDTRMLVTQNGKFDVHYAIANPNSNPANLPAWMEFVAKGGMIWDIQLAEYLLAGMEQQYHMLSLDEIAPTYGGNVKLDEVKALWDAGVATIDIPEDLLMRYLTGRETEDGFEEGDIGNTELVFRAQWKRAQEEGQLKSILLNMGALLFTIEAERNGMYVDKPLGLEIAEGMAKDLAQITMELDAFLPDDLPFEFNWNSRFHKSALIFGGTVNYKAPVLIKDDDGNQTYAQKEETHVLLADGGTLEFDAYMEAVRTNTAPEAVRFAGGKNKGQVKTKKVKVDDLTKPKSRIEQLQYQFDGFTDPVPAWETKDSEGNGTGVYSLDADNMAELTENTDVPFLKTLGRVVKLTKDLGTYFITTDDKGNEKGMLTLVQLDSIIHHMLNHTSTVTGRFSSSNPNLQNIPKGQKSRIKEVFKSRFPDGVIIQSDFSSLEVYVQAILTGAVNLILDLKNKVDMHVMRLSIKEGRPYEEVLELAKPKDKAKEGTPEHLEWDYKRTKAKIFSFQRAYGAGAPKIAATTGMSVEDVEALIAAEDARYPEITTYFTEKTKEIKKNRVPTGDIREHPEIKGLKVQLGKGYSRTPDGKKYSYKEVPAPKWMLERGKTAERTNFMPTEVKNYEVQGTGGEFAKAGAYLSVRAFYSLKNFDGQALLVNQVHDAEYADAAKKAAIKAAALLHVCMEEASTFMEWWFKWPLPLPVPSDTTWGNSMAEEKSFTHPGFQKAVDVFRPWVRKQFIGNYTPSWDKE